MRYFGGPYDGELCQLANRVALTQTEKDLQRMLHNGEYVWSEKRKTWAWMTMEAT